VKLFPQSSRLNLLTEPIGRTYLSKLFDLPDENQCFVPQRWFFVAGFLRNLEIIIYRGRNVLIFGCEVVSVGISILSGVFA
jgi:hypothetical protein